MPDDAPLLHLNWESELPNGCVRVGRHVLTKDSRRMPPHDHEFAEIFWVEVGRCEHHIDGSIEYVSPHEYRCIRPKDVHGVYCDGNPCTLVNVSFRPEPIAALAERYRDDWLWPEEGPPRGGVLPPMARERISAWLDILAAPHLRQIDLDSFLLDLTRALTLDLGAPRSTGLPVWLADALEVFTQPRYLCGGVVELARLCGRSREHINRIVRASQRRRATDLVNAIRLDWVAQQLRVTDYPVEELAAQCGLPNLAHFYRLFRAAFGETPAAWRRKVRVAFPRNEALNVSPWGRQ